MEVAISQHRADRRRVHFRQLCRCPAADPTAQTAADASTLDLEQLMKIEVVVAGSKRAQQTRDVASFVSVVTAADIKQHGYRTLSAVLNTLPVFTFPTTATSRSWVFADSGAPETITRACWC